MSTKQKDKKAAIIISAILILSASLSLLCLLLPDRGSNAGDGYAAQIYQDGRLLYSIPLHDISESRTFTVENAEGGVNEIEVRPGSIGIISADCPDKICVRQGFITDTKLPITCLPNRLVILLRPLSDKAGDPPAPDVYTY